MSNFEIALKQAIKNTQEQTALSVAEGTTDGLYDAGNGIKCVVGHLITNDNYREDFEYNSVVDHDGIIPAIEASIQEELDAQQVEIIMDLQTIHDNAVTTAQMSDHWNDNEEKVKLFRQVFQEGIDGAVESETLPRYCIVA